MIRCSVMKVSEPYGVGLVTHIKPDRSMLLSELFKEVQFEDFEFLLSLGSIYVDLERVLQDRMVTPNSLVRVHRKPKRHPVQEIHWQNHIIENNDDFIIVDKPYGIPTHPTVDNALENVIYQVSLCLGQELFITHRLDSETTGLLLFAKTKKFQQIFNYLMSNKLVQKKYKAQSLLRPTEGTHIHYIKPESFLPKIASPEAVDGWKRCELVIEKVENIILPNGENGFESQIHLVTGRTHQIRAQMMALGTPIFGDTLYGDSHENFPIGLKAFLLKFSWPQIGKDFLFEI